MIIRINLIRRSFGKAKVLNATIKWPDAKDQADRIFWSQLLFSYFLIIWPCKKESVINSSLYKIELSRKHSGIYSPLVWRKCNKRQVNTMSSGIIQKSQSLLAYIIGLIKISTWFPNLSILKYGIIIMNTHKWTASGITRI